MSPASDDLSRRARDALQNEREADVLPAIEAAARTLRDASLWQWTGLLHRSLGDSRPALAAFRKAIDLAPNDPLIAHGLAQVTAEAGLDAREEFERALRLRPTLDALLGHSAARYAAGDGRVALDELASVLATNPRWTSGHLQWAQFASMCGEADRATETIDRALAGEQSADLYQARISILASAGRHGEAAATALRSLRSNGNDIGLRLALATALSESDDLPAASEQFDALDEPHSVDHAVRLARHLARTSEWARLGLLVDDWIAGDSAQHLWPYASIAWRHSGDPRWRWLEGDERLILVQDLDDGPELGQLAQLLRDLHTRSGRYLDQSVRGGTQTDGPLLRRIEPEIEALRGAIERAVGHYIAQLPPIDPGHPMLRNLRDDHVRFAGSWSVRLTGAGHHSNHVHPQGWISSAFYVAVPEANGDEGWLSIGEPEAGLHRALAPIRMVEPKPGRLVLFPSMMWHGTRPITLGERMTVAFDIAAPRHSQNSD